MKLHSLFFFNAFFSCFVFSTFEPLSAGTAKERRVYMASAGPDEVTCTLLTAQISEMKTL